IVYGAAWDSAPLKLFQRRLDGSDSVPLQFPNADVLSVSNKGELAISLGREFDGWLNTGTLAKAPLLGTSIRKVLDGVSWADWNPSGDALLLVRRVANEDRLEYPAGTVLYRTPGYIAYPRFSPSGDRIAFLDHPSYGDNRGNVAVITLGGQKTELVHDWAGIEGMAWSADGSEVWFTGSQSGSWCLYAAGGRRGLRAVWRTPGNLVLHDVDRKGRVLVANTSTTSTVRALGRGEQHEHDLSVGWSVAPVITNDEKNALVVSYSGDDAYYDLYLRPMNGGAPTRIGEGEPIGFSPDGKWALSMILSTPAKLVVYGTESEATKPVDVGGMAIESATMLPDGGILLVVNRPTGGTDFYVQDENGAHRTRLPIEHAVSGRPRVSPDGLKVAVNARDSSTTQVYALSGQHLRDVPAPLTAAGWSSDSRSLFVFPPKEFPIRIQRLDIVTGALTPWKDVMPSDIAGALGHTYLCINPDGDAYAYSIERMMTDLFIVDGLR
ncbi:MAG: hypothetical protein WB973_21230, partial [Thermoanaerobaculia bacterium]